MKRFAIVPFLFFLGGIISFAAAFYVFRAYQDFLATFAYYDIPEEIYILNSETAKAVFNFKIGIAKYILLGVVAWIASIFFFIKIKKNE